MMHLSELLGGMVNHFPVDGEVSSICSDTREIKPNGVFFACSGLRSHGLDHLDAKERDDLLAIVYEPPYDITDENNAQKYIPLAQLSQKMSEIAKRFYAPQFSQLPIGVTGTNGKTTVTNYIAQLANYAVIGTMGFGRVSNLNALSLTTPDAFSVQRILSDLANDEKAYDGVAMEVSSHALALHRVAAVDFGVAVFTNLTQDHLDFHGDMQSYFAEKKKLFLMPSVHTAVINFDDAYGKDLVLMCQQLGKRIWVYGESPDVTAYENHVHIKNIALSVQGIKAIVVITQQHQSSEYDLEIPVWGRFNVHNLVAAMLALVSNGCDIEQLFANMANLQGVKGRMEPIYLKNGAVAVIDYAHTPDALENTLKSLREQGAKKIITVFGCGGDRDQAKRPKMAQVVEQYADQGIVTDDNPRTEPSEKIIADICQGIQSIDKFEIISSRERAIWSGLNRLKADEVLLIAGKGHESYQIIGDKVIDFSDHDVVMRWQNATL